MAKSTRSKVKRSYRAKKRDDSVYAATEAARLERLSSKLRAICEADKDGDVELPDESAESTKGLQESAAPGWFLLLGLIDHSDVNFESLERIERAVSSRLVDAY